MSAEQPGICFKAQIHILVTGMIVKALARELNVSYRSFRHTFQQHTGSTPTNICWNCA
jgi:AraC-like DNA-binding protein